jgi:hypothetical protein
MRGRGRNLKKITNQDLVRLEGVEMFEVVELVIAGKRLMIK